MLEKTPLVSVIITTKNEEKHISNCLKSIQGQTYPQYSWEILVVDNNSTDRTKEIARKFTDKVHDQGPERSAQRNFGVAKASGEWVLYLDADMILSANALEECVAYVQKKPATVGLYISEIILGKDFWSQVRRFERSFYDGTVIDGARFIKRDVFLELGGFDTSLTGPEDWDLDKRLRRAGKVELVPRGKKCEAVVYHNESEFNLRKYLRKKSYYTKSFDRYIRKWGRDDPDIRKQFGLWHRLVGVFVEEGKWISWLSHPGLFLGMYFLRLLVGARWLIFSIGLW